MLRSRFALRLLLPPLGILVILTSAVWAPGGDARAAEPSTPGALSVHRPDGTLVEMPLRHTSVRIDVTAFVARATIEQVFENPFDEPVEAVYTFPLGSRAAVDDFELVIGERTIRGEIRRREEARRIYETARATGYQAALLEQERPNVFTQSVANLEPGREIRVRIRTVETLVYERGIYRLAFPLVVGPRYVPGGRAGLGAKATTPVPPTEAVPDADRITPPVLRPGFRSGHDVEIAVAVDAGVPIGEIESPSHELVVCRPSASAAGVRLAPNDTLPNKDFLLRWNVASETPAVGLLAHRTGVDGFFTLLVQPKGEVGPGDAMPKEIVLVLDTSGSMSGVPLEGSKRFLRSALRTLGPDDTFNLIRFSGAAETYAGEPLANDRHAVREALDWVERLRGGGGTEMLAGLRAAFARKPDPKRMRMVVFLTDGYIGNEHQILGAIAEVLGDARIFTLGIGSSVNHYLLDRMARLGNGAYAFIRPDERVNAAVDRFRGWVTRPYLTDLVIDWGALPVLDFLPEAPRDLFSGQTLTLVGRYAGAAEGTVTVRGRLGGRPWEQSRKVRLPDREEAHAPLGSLWARRRIEELMLSSPGEVTRSIRAEVTALALEYRLMSPFTSFVAVDDSRVVNPGGESRTVQQALPLPEGVSFAGVFGDDGPPVLWAAAEGEGLRPEDAGVTSAPGSPDQARYDETLGRDVVVHRYVSPQARARGPRVAGQAAPVVEQLSVMTSTASIAAGDVARNYASAVGGVANAPSPPSAELVLPETVAAGAGPVYGRAQGGFAAIVPLEEERKRKSTGKRRDKQAALGYVASLSQTSAPAADSAARAASGRLLEASLRLLADLAEDGRLSAAEGRPALAALLGAQVPGGAISETGLVQAFATWALLEAAAALPDDPWVAQAATRAEKHLASLAGKDGWPGVAGGKPDAETTRWALLVLRRAGSTEAPQISPPSGEPSKPYRDLRRVLAGSAVEGGAEEAPRLTPFQRLLRALPGGHLKAT